MLHEEFARAVMAERRRERDSALRDARLLGDQPESVFRTRLRVVVGLPRLARTTLARPWLARPWSARRAPVEDSRVSAF